MSTGATGHRPEAKPGTEGTGPDTAQKHPRTRRHPLSRWPLGTRGRFREARRVPHTRRGPGLGVHAGTR